MGLEEDIKQSKFNSEHHKAVVNLMFTFSWLEKPLKHIFSAHKLTSTQFNILRILKGSFPNPMSPQDIKAVMLHKKSDLTRLLDRLVAKDLIERNLCPSNRRKMDIKITNSGLDLVEKINPKIKIATEDMIAQNISTDEAKMLNSLIDKLRG